MGEPQVAAIVRQLVRQFAVVRGIGRPPLGPAASSRDGPRISTTGRRMGAVGGGPSTRRRPTLCCAGSLHYRRGERRAFRSACHWVGLEHQPTAGIDQLELVADTDIDAAARTIPITRCRPRCATDGPDHPSRSNRPTTRTARALGAHTTKRTPSTPSWFSGCAPSAVQSRSCRPSPKRCRSSSPREGRKRYGSPTASRRPSAKCSSIR